MTALQGLFSLEHNIRLIIPSTQQNGAPVEKRAEYIAETLRIFTDRFGGATSYEAMGAWNGKTGLTVEKTTIVEAYATAEAVEAGIQNVLSLAHSIKRACNQESVAVVYDGAMYFI